MSHSPEPIPPTPWTCNVGKDWLAVRDCTSVLLFDWSDEVTPLWPSAEIMGYILACVNAFGGVPEPEKALRELVVEANEIAVMLTGTRNWSMAKLHAAVDPFRHLLESNGA